MLYCCAYLCTYDFYERLMEKNANCHTSIACQLLDSLPMASLILVFKMWTTSVQGIPISK